MAQVINSFGKMTGWNNITTNLLGRDLVGITEIKYDDETKKEYVYGAGNKPIGLSEGNYEAKAEISLQKEEVLGLQQSLPAGAGIQDIEPFDITVEYANKKGVITKDRLRNCVFKNNGREAKNNEGVIIVKLDLALSHIEWNVI